MKKACIAALSSSVHTKPSGPSARWNILVATRKGSSESEEESGITEESSLVMGERGGGSGRPLSRARQRDGDCN